MACVGEVDGGSHAAASILYSALLLTFEAVGENGGESRGVCSSCSFLLVKVFGVLSVLSVIIIIIIKCLSVCLQMFRPTEFVAAM